MNVDLIYSIGGAFTNFSFVPISILMIISGAYKQYRAFTLYIILMAIWGYADHLMGQTDAYIGIWRCYNFCNILNPWAFYVFSNEFTKKYNKKNIIILGSICAFFLFLNYYHNLLIPDAIVEMRGIELVKSIYLYDIFVLYYCTLFIMGTWWIFKNYTKDKKTRTLILFACTLTIIGDAYSFGTVYFQSWYDFPYIAYIMCFLPYCVTYLIFRHRLFDARSTLLTMVQGGFIVSIGALVGAFFYGILALNGFPPLPDIPTVLVLLSCLVVIFYLAKSPRIHSWFQLSDMRELEQGVSEFLASNIVHESLEKIIESITSAIKNGLKIDQIMLINRTEMKMYPKLSEKLAYIPKVIQGASVKEAKNEEERTQKKLDYLPELESLGELCIPIYIEHTLAYLLILPEKKSQENYTQREKKVINMMRQKIALSLQILEYNQILRDEVDRQTLQINEQNIKLEASYQKLETLDHEKDVFMNMAAHELRTPMTIIRGYADILLEGSTGSIAPAQKKLIENILRGSQSLLDLVNDLLDLSRIDAGKMELKYESCDVKQFTYDIYENFKALMAKKNMQFKLEESLNTNYELCTDKAKLTLIYNNLLSNAYKYTPEHGDVLFKTSTVVEDNTAWLTFSITDSGVGIPTDELPKLFDRFANISTHNNIAATIQSTGLGLSIVKKIVTGMGGTIKAESIIGKGSTFTVSLPYNPPKKG